MSYDLIFWRGTTTDAPKDVLQRFSRLEPVDGIIPLHKDEVIEAFRSAFQGGIEIKSRLSGGGIIYGPMFELELYEQLNFIWVTCSWEILKQPQLLQKLTIAGYCRLGCHMYNPQIDEFTRAM